MALLRRSYAVSGLRVRAAGDPDERLIEGVVVPFGQVIDVQDSPNGPRYRETIARGAISELDASRVNLEALPTGGQGYNTHAGAVLVGRGESAEIRDDGLAMSFRVARTAAGDEALELARAGVLRDLSASFAPISQRTRPDGVIERTAIDVRRVAVVERGAYDAPITAVRAATEGTGMAENTSAPVDATDDEETTDETAAPSGARPNRTRVTVDVERAERAAAERETVGELARSAGPRGGIGGISITRSEPIYGPRSEYSFLTDGFMASRGDGAARERQDRHRAHLAEVGTAIERAASWDGINLSRAGDVLSSEIPGAYPNDYLPGLLTPRILKGRPMGGFYDRFPIADARPRIFPKVTTSTTVAVQSAEGAALSATDFGTTAVTATPLMYGAYTDVSRQTIDGADPAATAMILQDLLEAYGQASEAVIKTAVEAGASAGVAITAATPYAGVLANVVNYYGTRFVPAEGVFIPSALFSVLLAQGDTTGRPFLPMIGQTNSDGSVAGGGIEANVLGASTRLSWASTVNVCTFGKPSDYVIYESSIAQFSYDQPVGPQAVRIGIWAYLVVGTRLGSLKTTAA